ncbi:NADH:ubiquinone oxidoreductase kd subunit [Geopyxis carbonaria]|nr:NADH:ubiquinone oxidoreductase kd subunit [Geopyxis carbonaria]
MPPATAARPLVAARTVVARQTSTRTMASHSSHYDPPSGWFLGVRPGETPKKEGWEGIFIYGFFGSLAAAAVGYAYKPDTSIQTWALEEARRRLEAEGHIPDSTKPVKITEQLKRVSGN